MQMRTRTDDFPEHAAGKEALSDAANCLGEQPDLGCIQKPSLEEKAGAL